MSDILDQTADFSLIADSMNLPVSTGCELYTFFGGSLARSIKNFGGDFAPLEAFGNPTISANSATLDSSHYFGMPASAPTDNSETYIVAFSIPTGENPPTQNLTMFSSAVGSYPTGVEITAGASGVGGPCARVGINNAGSATQLQLTVGGNNTQTYAAEMLPIVAALTIDMSAMSITWRILSLTNWGSVTPNSTTMVIPAGAVRYATPTRGYIGKMTNASTVTTNAGYIHFFGKWNRVLTTNEINAVFANVNGVLAKRGLSAA